MKELNAAKDEDEVLSNGKTVKEVREQYGIKSEKKESDSERLKRKAEDNYGDWSKKDLEAELESLKEKAKDGSLGKYHGGNADNRIRFEFKDGNIMLDGTVVGTVDKEIPEDYRLNMDGNYLLDTALAGDNTSMFLNNSPMKAVVFADGNSDTVIMPMSDEGEVDYEERRSRKAGEKAAKNEKLAANRKANEELLNRELGNIDSQVDRVYNNLDNKLQSFNDEDLKRNYDILNLDMNKIMDRSLTTLHDNVDKKTGASFRSAYAYAKLKEKYPEVIDRFKAEMQKRGIEFKKSLFDDFLFIENVEEDIDDMEEEIEERSLWNDYSAEQPELFNSTALKVREAYNRHCDCL